MDLTNIICKQQRVTFLGFRFIFFELGGFAENFSKNNENSFIPIA